MKRKQRQILILSFILIFSLILSPFPVYAENDNSSGEGTDTAVSGTSGLPVSFENGIHYITDPEYPDEKITLFCMNNKLHWPHHTDDMGNIQVPDYVEGYLTPDNFDSPDDYKECMSRLSKLLYVGYPYNGEKLYKIMDSAELCTPTENQFNEMLVPPPSLQTAFPYLGHHAFTYQDWVTQDEEHLNELRSFMQAVGNLYYGGETSNGLTYSNITSLPFYKAVFCMLYGTELTPLQNFAQLYSNSYFVTQEQAYHSTQDAIWRLLHFYHIENNDLENLNHSELAQILYNFSEQKALLDHEPTLQDIHLSGSLKFIYNPKDGYWHSGTLQVIEPPEYHGLYHLHLPDGMTALCDNLTYVYGNEEYELISETPPTTEETFEIQADFVWLKDFKQYSPLSDIEVNGKKFQHMAGAVIRKTSLFAAVPVGITEVGSLSISKEVIGEENCQDEFQFKIRLPYHTGINGLYGDMEFHKGTALFSLKDGETKRADNLPEGAYYEVAELETELYKTCMTNASGEILKNNTINVHFTNTKIPEEVPPDKEPPDKEPPDKEPPDKEPPDKEPSDKEPPKEKPADKEASKHHSTDQEYTEQTGQADGPHYQMPAKTHDQTNLFFYLFVAIGSIFLIAFHLYRSQKNIQD